MITLGWIFCVALATSLALTPLARRAAVRLGAVDRPDGKRKLQKQPVPRWGGVAVYLALVLALAAVQCLGGELPPGFGELSWVIGISAGFVCLLGCVDDRWELRSKRKLLLQIASVTPVVWAGWWWGAIPPVDRLALFGQEVHIGWLGMPLTVFWLVGCINALNLVDGMDGLASVVGLSTAMILAVIATSMHHADVALAAVGLAGALCGFLVHNLPPARIYLGDSGSMVIGLVLGILGIQGSLKTATTLSITAPAVVMSIPLLDTVLAILRRKLTGKPFDSPDRGHIHHRLLDRGLTTWQALCIIGSLCLATGASAAAATMLRSDAMAWVVTLFLLVLMIRLRTFGHHEVSLVRTQAASWLTRLASGLLNPVHAQRPAPSALSFEAAWAAIAQEAAHCQARHVKLTLMVGGQRRAEHQWEAGGLPSATLNVALTYACRFDLILGDEHDTACRFQVALDPAPANAAGNLAPLLQLLQRYGAHWKTQPDEVPQILPWNSRVAPGDPQTTRVAA